MEIKERDAAELAGKKFTLRLGPAAVEDIEWISQQYDGASITEVIKKALATEKYLLEQQNAGEIIVLENKSSRRQRELVLR
jgi:hypothetical protein